MEKRSPRRSEREWRRIVAEQENSTETVEQFCERRSLVQGTFESWRRRVLAPAPKAAAAPGFVQVTQPAPVSTRDVILQVGDMTVRCPSDLGVSAIADLARALRA